ncbi:MAG TPA: iron-sulfur cluster assembly scaffold protein [Terriglobales bacterium]|jgi:nitrogen fixation NifU-like protein|nr:iron-sulfur cluster assembly scaffold protein [Terriglobales bacterium]
MYPPQLLDHFEHPRNAGDLPSPTASAQLENPVCGDVLRLTLIINHGNITEARFRAKGCVASIACGSLLTEMITNQTIVYAKEISKEDLSAGLGGLNPESSHAATLAVDTLRAALTGIKS